ncbi:MAG TPA: MFS transporter [Bacillota bacterium]|jgi:MFS family permease|nr:MFS transporter [Peptococcaceae bacterium]HPZ44198.1 MFS transporter [Bacillota bacterium]HQD75741.1 MFS transporter [Bacillota bacterium]HUM58950.1 MFS transporter [Bacillota bacterium]
MRFPSKDIIRALSSRNYRLFFTGQGISLIGTWMQSIAMSWLAYRLTGSEFLLGVIGFTNQIPSLVFTPLAGVLADRWNRHHMLIGTQVLAMLQAFTAAVLALTGVITVWHLIALSLFQGLVTSFDIPARQSLVVLMVDKKEDLPNAIALNSFLFNGARLVGPTVAGILIAVLSEGMCFLINGVSYLAVITALLAIRINAGHKTEQDANLLQQLKEGFGYAFSSVSIRTVLSFSATISFAGMPYSVLMPVIAREVLSGGPDTFGYLITASGLGAVTGALYMAVRRNVAGLSSLLPVSMGIFGIGLVALSQSRVFGISVLLMLLTGFGMMTHMASNNTILQTIVDDDKRGRVMSLYTMSFFGMAPFGSLVAGTLASRIGAPATIMCCGLICLLAAMLFAGKASVIKGEIDRQTGNTTI